MTTEQSTLADDAAAPGETAESAETFTEALFGKEVLGHKALAWFRAWPSELQGTTVIALLGVLVFIPYLGAVGLWDCWETHYGEVAREMIQRNDYVHPFWENSYFFSKPAFTMWMMAAGMQAARGGPSLALVLGVVLLALGGGLFTGQLKRILSASFEGPHAQFWGLLSGTLGAILTLLGLWGSTVKLEWKFADIVTSDGALPLFTEWGFRLPFALFSIMAMALLTYCLSRLVNVRAGLATGLVMCTMPMYFLLTRQAVTDTPFVSSLVAGLSCAMVGWFDAGTKRRTEWWYAAYFFFGIGTLSKGLLGFGIPMVVGFLVLATAFLNLNDVLDAVKWALKKVTVPLGIGAAAMVLAAGAAYVIGSARGTVFMAPQFNPQLPPPLSAAHWLGIMWGSLALWTGVTFGLRFFPPDASSPRPKLIEILFHARLGTGILVFLGVCLPWYYEMFTFWRVDDESKLFWWRFIVHDHFNRLGAGVYTPTPGGTFIYFVEQAMYGMFPWVVLLPGAMATVARIRPARKSGEDMLALVSVFWFGVAWGLVGLSATKFHHYAFPMLPPLAILMGIYIDRVWREGVEKHMALLLFGVPIFILVGKDLAANPKNFTDLFVFNYDRPYPAFLTERIGFNNMPVKQIMGSCFTLFGVVAGVFVIMRAKFWSFATVLAGVLAFTLWFNWSHWVDLSHHWTQRDQFWRYFTQRRPGEPIAAFMMNWRGETFYSRNEVKQLKDNYNVQMQNFAAQPGRKWSLVEHNRLGWLKNAVGPEKTVTLVDKDLNNKFVLVSID